MGVTVITPMDTPDLTTIRRLKLELSIPLTDSSQDELLTAWIHEESETFASMCKRVLAAETVSESFDLRAISTESSGFASGSRTDSGVILSRYPVIEVQSVTIDETEIDASTYVAESEAGKLRRARTSGGPTGWSGTELVVVYRGGYDSLLGTLPRRIERAVLTMCKSRKFSATRDPTVRSIQVIGAMSESYGDANATLHGQSAEVEAAVAYYTDHRV